MVECLLNSVLSGPVQGIDLNLSSCLCFLSYFWLWDMDTEKWWRNRLMPLVPHRIRVYHWNDCVKPVITPWGPYLLTIQHTMVLARPCTGSRLTQHRCIKEVCHLVKTSVELDQGWGLCHNPCLYLTCFERGGCFAGGIAGVSPTNPDQGLDWLSTIGPLRG